MAAAAAPRGHRRAPSAHANSSAPRKRAPHIHRRQQLAALFACNDAYDGADGAGPAPTVDAQFISRISLTELYEPAADAATAQAAFDDMPDDARAAFLQRMRQLGEAWCADSRVAPPDPAAPVAADAPAWLARGHRHREPPPAPLLPEHATSAAHRDDDDDDLYHERVTLALLDAAHRRYLVELPKYDASERFFLPLMCAPRPYDGTLLRFDKD
ncbi:hypothetical protein LCGC14_2203800, partial [marine sediment metagenome]